MSQTKHSHSHLNAVPPRVGVRGRSFIRKNYGGALENVPVDAFNSIPLTKRKPVMKRHRRAIFTAPPSETVPTKKVSLWQKIKTMILSKLGFAKKQPAIASAPVNNYYY